MRPILDGQITESVIVTGNTPFTRPENRVMYPGLDGLRAVAFLMVFGQHYYQLPWGWTGVDLFFVLSGFLITGILWDTRCDRHRVRNFYVRRTLKIFPLYYGVMLAMLALQPLANWDWNWRFLVWPAYLGNYARFVHPYVLGEAWQRVGDFEVTWSSMRTQFDFHLGHFWSLCVEEQFYLICPWVVFFIPDRRKLAWLCASALPICLCFRLGGEHWLPQWTLESEILYRATPFRIDALLTGGLIALLVRGPFGERILRLRSSFLPLDPRRTPEHLVYVQAAEPAPPPMDGANKLWSLCSARHSPYGLSLRGKTNRLVRRIGSSPESEQLATSRDSSRRCHRPSGYTNPCLVKLSVF